MLTIHSIVNQPVPSNCYVLYDKAIGEDCIVIDPGSKDDVDLLSFIDKSGLRPKYIVLTHEHFDHCWGVNKLVELFGIPIICSRLCADCIGSEKRNCSVFYDYNERFFISGNVICLESINFVLHFANTELKFFPSPGHSAASVCFSIQNYLFTGDTLIKSLRTVTKLPTGSVSQLKDSIAIIEKLKGHNLMVCPGHGEQFPLDEYALGNALK